MDEHVLVLVYLWLALGALVALVVWKGRTAIKNGLQAKIRQIAFDLEEAERLKEEAQQTLAEYKRRQREALSQAEAIVDQAKREAEQLQKLGQEKLEAALAHREAQAMDKIAQAEEAAMREVRNTAVEIAAAATTEILRERMSGAEGDRLIDEAIKDLDGKLH